MGVIKNLMVRIGADIRGYRSGMKDAANATSTTSQKINQHTSSMKKSVGSTFSTICSTIDEYTTTVERTKEKYNTVTQNTERLADKVQQLKGVYDKVKEATAGVDLSAPLTKQIVDKQKYLDSLNAKIRETEIAIRDFGDVKTDKKQSKLDALKRTLNDLIVQSDRAGAELAELNDIAEKLGDEKIGYASSDGLNKLEGNIRAAENELNTAKVMTQELASKLQSLRVPSVLGRVIKNIGVDAANAARDGVSNLWQKLKSISGSVLKGITSLPSKLENIGSSASASCGGLGKMVKSIRNIGIASLGMKVASSMFDRLRSIISSYISQNEELNDTISAMKDQLGEALLPAINLVLAAMQRLMPVVTAVSNGINSVLTSLFGNMVKTTSAIKKAADTASSAELYGFDQITKVSDSDSSSSTSSGTEGAQSTLVQKLTGWINRLKAAFVAGDWRKLGQIVGEGVNGVFASIDAVDVGAKIGTFIKIANTAFHGMLTTIDFNGIGAKAGKLFTSAIGRVDWNEAGDVIGRAILALPTVLTGFITGTDWKTVGQAISDCLKSVIARFTSWLQTTDWLKVGQSAANLIGSIDWGGIVSNMFKLLGAALGAGVTLLWGAIGDALTSIRDYFAEKIEDAGGDVALGLLTGIINGLGNIGSWMKTNITAPFVEGFRGLGNGIVGTVEEWINTAINGINSFFSKIGQVLSSVAPGVSISDMPLSMTQVSLPRAARGYVATQATNLTVGEDGTEMVMPIERHTEWLDVLASKLAAKTSGGSGAGGTAIIQVILGSRKITEYVIKDINQITRENGVCPIRV